MFATGEGEKKLRRVWVTQLEKEVANERKALGLPEVAENADDALLRALSA